MASRTQQRRLSWGEKHFNEAIFTNEGERRLPDKCCLLDTRRYDDGARGLIDTGIITKSDTASMVTLSGVVALDRSHVCLGGGAPARRGTIRRIRSRRGPNPSEHWMRQATARSAQEVASTEPPPTYSLSTFRNCRYACSKRILAAWT